MEKEEIKRRKMLFLKFKDLWKTKYDTIDFKEPIGILMRRTGNAEFLEGLKKGELPIKHSDGEDRVLYLNGKTTTFDYGSKKFQGYILHEDFPTPLPEDPIVTTETMGIAVDKALNDMRKLKENTVNATFKGWMNIIIAAGFVLGIYLLFKKDPVQVVQVVAQNLTTP